MPDPDNRTSPVLIAILTVVFGLSLVCVAILIYAMLNPSPGAILP